MRDRDLAPAAAVAAIVCCGGSALAAGLVGGVALAAVGQFTAVTVVGLGLVVLIARRIDRRHHRGAPSDPPNTADRSTHDQKTPG
jgi:uncharacterized protein (DUF2062 family)